LNEIGVDSRGGHSNMLRSVLRNRLLETTGCSWSQDGRIL